jgi:hypothetical protein
VHPHITNAILVLERNLVEIQEAKKVLQDHEDHIITTLSNLRKVHVSEETKGTLEAEKPKQTSSRSEKAEFTGIPSAQISISGILLQAVRAQKQSFCASELRTYVASHYADWSPSISSDRISKEIYALRKKQIVAFDVQRGPGVRSSYKYQQQYDKR